MAPIVSKPPVTCRAAALYRYRAVEHILIRRSIHRHTNVVLFRQSGVGKSHLIQPVGLSACAVGYRVCYATSASLLMPAHGRVR
jgi:DNA replication protein DnaC